MSELKFLSKPPRFLFFTGKGGVGKTSVACATSLKLVSEGQKVLLVSTDPASNIAQVFGVQIGNTITPIPSTEGLWALEIDPEQAAAAYRERIISPVRGLLPEAELSAMEEQLSGSCTTEIASFNEFTDLLANPEATVGYDHVIFDTAPTGHTIRLLQLPGSWTDFLNEGKGDASCLGPLSGLEKQRATYSRAVSALKDPLVTRLVLVSRAQSSALKEASRTLSELATIDLAGNHLIVNGVLPAEAGSDELAVAIRRREAAALAAMPENLRVLEHDVLPLRISNMVGKEALLSLLDAVSSDANLSSEPLTAIDVPHEPLRALVDAIEADEHGLVLCMGKGGVGKTTVAAAVAAELAQRGHDVTLTTTDPAAHLSDTLQGEIEHLSVSRIDPESAIQAYQDQVMRSKGSKLDEVGKAALWEDLQSPCTEEVAVFQQFSRAVHESMKKFVIVDTAPTGHTLLLLDAAGSYHREVARQMGDSMGFITPLMRLQDPVGTKVLLVTLAEPTPVSEAEELQADLRRAGINPYGWVINNSIAAARPVSPFLQHRAANELMQIERVRQLTDHVAIIPLMTEEPVGAAGLAEVLG